MTDDRRLNEAEVAAVLRRAAEDSTAQGLTVAQVEEIAASVGISADSVRRALIESANGALRPATVSREFGVPTGVSKDVALPGVLTPAAWDVLVSTMRATFNAYGRTRQSGVVREWRNGNLRIALEPTANGDRIRMSTQKAGGLRGPLIGSAGSLIYAAALFAAATRKPALMILAAIPLTIAGALAAWPFLTLPRWARSRADQFEIIAREAAALATPMESTPASPTLTASGTDSGPRILPASPAVARDRSA
jgi:hypothetical protein